MPVAQPPPVANAPAAVIRAAQQKVVPEAICLGHPAAGAALLCPLEPSHPTGAHVVFRPGGYVYVVIRGAKRISLRPLKPSRKDPSAILTAHVASVAHRVDGRRTLWRIRVPHGLTRAVTAAELNVSFFNGDLGVYLAAATVR